MAAQVELDYSRHCRASVERDNILRIDKGKWVLDDVIFDCNTCGIVEQFEESGSASEVDSAILKTVTGIMDRCKDTLVIASKKSPSGIDSSLMPQLREL